MIDHWVLIDFAEYKSVNKILIEHHCSSACITKQFSIYGLTQDGWIKLENIKENTKNITGFYYEIPKKLKKIKISIEKPNYSIDYTARIKLINIS